MLCTFANGYKEKVPISERNRNFIRWMIGFETTNTGITIRDHNRLATPTKYLIISEIFALRQMWNFGSAEVKFDAMHQVK